MSLINNNVNDDMKQHEYQQSVLTMQKSVTITVTPQRSNSLDYLNFEEKRQLIASSLSLSDILQVGPAVAQAAKDVAAASSVIGKESLQIVIITWGILDGFIGKYRCSHLLTLIEKMMPLNLSFFFVSLQISFCNWNVKKSFNTSHLSLRPF